MAVSTSRNNILAGSFLLGAIALGVVTSFVLSDMTDRLKATKEYTVRFSIADGAAGIKSGSPVLLGGQPVGKVVKVTIVPDVPASADPSMSSVPGMRGSIDILVSIDAKYTFYDNAQFFLEKPLLGSLTSINIASMGSRDNIRPDQQIGPGPELAAGEPILGTIAPPSFLSQAGLGTEQVMDIKQMISQAKGVIEQVHKLLDENADKVTAAMDNIKAGSGDARGAIKGIADKVPGWTTTVDSILANADEGAKSITKLRDNANTLIDDGRGLIADGRGVINDNRPKIDRIIDNVDHSAITFRDNIDPLFAQARESMASFESLSTRLDTMVATEGPNVRHLLANTRLATDQLKLAVLEIRAQPWRLFIQPDTKELQQQLLYDSARSYASAVSDLRAASESLETIVGPGTNPATADAKQIAERMAELDAAFVKYREAEKKLFDQMNKTGK